jgi:hypothetical protein
VSPSPGLGPSQPRSSNNNESASPLHSPSQTATDIAAHDPPPQLISTDVGAWPRVELTLQRLRDHLANNYGGTAEGWLTNLGNVPTFRGPSVFMSTTLRELLGEVAVKGLENAPTEAKLALSGGIIGTAVLLNVAGAVRRSRAGQASVSTHAATAVNLAALSTAAGLIGRDRLGAAAPLLVKAAAYAGARGILDKSLSLSANSPGAVLTWPALLTEVATYALNQMGVNTLQGLADFSITSLKGILTSVPASLGNLMQYSAANTAGEIVDYLVDNSIGAAVKAAGSGRPALDGVSNLRIAAKPQLSHPNPLDTLLGPGTSRLTALTVLYLIVANLSHMGPEGSLVSNLDSTQLHALAALSFAAITGVNTVRTASRPPTLHAPANLEAGGGA